MLGRRIERHRAIETETRGWSDEELLRRLSGSTLLDHGHAAISLPRSNAEVFVKLLPLTALEREPQNRHSTANLFELPTYYQYRLGSCGFGAWRELEVHRMAHQWVVSGQCRHFPLLHDWRVLPIVSQGQDDRMSTERWGDDTAIQRRVSSIAQATSSVAVFVEYFPLTLSQWFRDRPSDSFDRLADVRETEAAVLDLLEFTNGQGLLHMDAHFENILTDGSQVYLSDHGLAISRTFDLDAAERTFFERHQNFDRCTAVTSLVHALVTSYDANEDWRQTVRDLTSGVHPMTEAVPVALRSYLESRGPVALAMGEFYGRLTADLTTEYPASSLQGLLDDI